MTNAQWRKQLGMSADAIKMNLNTLCEAFEKNEDFTEGEAESVASVCHDMETMTKVLKRISLGAFVTIEIPEH